ncbi:helix-turn-helix domain-containing protein [Rhodoferax aquaticus]|nr:AraC family transcriptional regulator [Rhodoferax aquaticus]
MMQHPLTMPLSLRTYGPAAGGHAHDFFQVLLGVSGTLELELEGKGRRIGAGQGCVIAPGEKHDFEAQGGAQCVVLDTRSAAWEGCTTSLVNTVSADALSRYLHVALQEPNATLQRVGPALLLDCWRASVQPAAKRQARAIDWLTLSQWCQTHLHGPLEVHDLATQVHLSPSQFAQRCKVETGQSPMQWVRAQRLARAQALRASGWDLSRSAERCGYASASALAAALRQAA